MDGLPPDALLRVLTAGSVGELLHSAAASKAVAAGARLALCGLPAVQAELRLDSRLEGGADGEAALDAAAFRAQALGRAPLRARFRPGHEPRTRERVAGLETLSSSIVTALLSHPLRALSFAQLEEDDMCALCSLLRAPSCRLEALHIDGFCRDDPSAERLAPIARALPPSCTELRVRYALPLARAFGQVPASVRSVGTLVLMAEVFYHSRVVGMTLSRFESSFPRLPQVEELDLVLGPGHYEAPAWAHTPEEAVAVFRVKFPALASLRVSAVVESTSSPPLLGLALAFGTHGVTVDVASLRAPHNPRAVESVAAGLRRAGVMLSCME